MSKSETAGEISEEITESMSWRHLIPVDSWAKECHDTSDEYFDARVWNMDSEKHLEAALDVEVARDQPREERVGLLNQRLAEIRGGEP